MEQLKEDAVISPTQTTQNTGITQPANTQTGMTTGDILGKDCDHKKNGYFGDGCFHLPEPITSKNKKEKIQKRELQD